MTKTTKIITIVKRIGAVTEIMKKIGSYKEYTLIPNNKIAIENNNVMIDEKVFAAKKDFFRTIRSI